MTLAQYWTIVLNHWKVIIASFLLVGLGAFAVSELLTPIYQSAAIVQVAIRSGTSQYDYYNGLLASNQLVQTEAVLATSDPVLRQVASHYPGLTVEQLSQEVTATSKVSTQLFEIDVEDPSPTRAAALANDIAATLIQQQLQEMQQGGAQGGISLIIAQSAQPALYPAKPKVLLNTATGLVAGLLLGIFLALLFEQLDTRVRTSELITQLLDWPILATIWRVGPKEELINPTGRNANVESFRILRTNIGFSAIGKPMRTLVVTSSTPHDGKSSIAANLAIFMAKAGKNTLLIDADLRSLTAHGIFSVPTNKMGLSNAILAFGTPAAVKVASHQQLHASIPELSSNSANGPSIPLDPFVFATDIPNLSVMPSGPLPPNPSELLDSQAMQRLFRALTISGAEVVIFDTPPLLGLSDASILASKVDGTIVVVDITRADKRHLKQVKALLEKAGANILGCVQNKKRRRRNDSFYSSYYYRVDEKRGGNSYSKKDANSAAVSSLAPEVSKQPKTQPQEDSLDRTVKIEPVHRMEIETRARPDISSRDTVKTTSAYPVQPETPSRPDLLDGRKGR